MATDDDRIRSIFEELESEGTQEYLDDSEDNVILESDYCCESEKTDLEIGSSQLVSINSSHCIGKDKKNGRFIYHPNLMPINGTLLDDYSV